MTRRIGRSIGTAGSKRMRRHLAAGLLAGAVAIVNSNVSAASTPSLYGAYIGAGYAEEISDFETAANLLERLLEVEPNDPLLQRRGLLANLNAGRMERAVDLARDQVAVYPPETDIATLTLVADTVRKEDWEGVLNLVNSSRPTLLARFAVPVISAWSLAALGDTAAAIEALEPLREENELPEFPNYHAGLIFLHAGQPEEAEAVLAQYADAIPDSGVGTLRVLVRAYDAQGRTEDAHAILEELAALHPGLLVVERDLAALEAGDTLPPMVDGPAAGISDAMTDLALRIRRQAPATALRYARLGVHMDAGNDLGRMIAASVLESVDRFDEAIDELAQVDPASVYDWDARIAIGENLIRLSRDDEAVEHLEALAEENPDDVEALRQLGYLMRLRHRFEEGYDYYDRALDRVDGNSPDDWALYYSRGITLERTGRWEEAERDLKKALELNPGDPLVLNYLGYSWIDQGVNIDEAMEMIREAVEQQRNNGFIVDSLGWAHYRVGQFEEAVLQLERAVQLEPGNAIVNDHLGDAYWRVGRRFEARYQWERALSQDPDDDLRETIERKLEEGLDAVEGDSDG